jgi:hypothetical protein
VFHCGGKYCQFHCNFTAECRIIGVGNQESPPVRVGAEFISPGTPEYQSIELPVYIENGDG